MIVDEKYAKFVRLLAQSRENRTFLNSDEDKAVEVLSNLFRISAKEVRIFAGNLCEHVGNQLEYIIALSEFIERGGTVCILLNSYNEDMARTSNLFKRLAYYKSEGKPIFVKTSTAKPYLASDPKQRPVHFTVGDNMAYRIETDIENRTALCNFNNPELAEKTAVFFDELFNREDVKDVDIIKLFENGNK